MNSATQFPQFTDERNVQILLALLKAHGIRLIIANPGTNNIPFVGGVQRDPFFTVFSGVDERHSAYLACGMAAALGEAVALACTGATASRNYLPALTEAYYRKLPILAITFSHGQAHVGNLWGQVTDRSSPPPDTARVSISVAAVHSNAEARSCELSLNAAILELWRHGGGPVHVNMESCFAHTYCTEQLPTVRKIERIDAVSTQWPPLLSNAKIAVWIGAHKHFSSHERATLERFLASRNAVALVDETSSYKGQYGIHSTLVTSQRGLTRPAYLALKPDLVIHIGEVSGDATTSGFLTEAAPVWRVSPDGELRDRLGRLEYIFEMSESVFFEHYSKEGEDSSNIRDYSAAWHAMDQSLRERLPDMPFSNLWIAQQLSPLLPAGCVLHLGILNSLRSWNYFPAPETVETMANVGGFGIDGCVSSLIGAALVRPDVLHFGVVGDLAFFYDLNALGNRHVGHNLRLLLVNNGTGGEFHRQESPGSKFGEAVNDFIAASGHFGSKSRNLVRHLAEDLGFRYFMADDKESFMQILPEFITGKTESSIIFECFTDVRDDAAAANAMRLVDTPPPPSSGIREKLKNTVPKCVKSALRELLK